VLHRIARHDPSAYPDWRFVGRGRFDDPRRAYRVLYAGETRRVCFLELLAPYRPSPRDLAALAAMPPGEGPDPVEAQPGLDLDEWRRGRVVAELRLAAGQPCLDLRRLETRETLRRALAAELARRHRKDFDAGDALTRDRGLTRRVSRWAYENAYHAIVYASRLDVGQTCWALFENRAVFARGSVSPVAHDDPDMLAVATAFGLVPTGSPSRDRQM
jgi:hypothetical protein